MNRYRLVQWAAAAAAAVVVLANGSSVAAAVTNALPTPLTTPLPSPMAGTSVCPAPSITTVATAAGQQAAAPGTEVYVTGSNLSASLCSTTLTLGSRSITPTVDSSSKLQFAMPAGAPGGAVRVTLTDAGGGSASSSGTHDFVALPVIGSLSSNDPQEGQSLTAAGSGFSLAGLPGAAATISYCGAPAQPATIVSDTQLAVAGPGSYCAGPASVTFSTPTLSVGVPGGSVSVASQILSVNPTGPVAAGATVTIGGTGFGPAGSATIGGVAATVTSWADRSVSVVVPPGAGSAALQLTRSDGTSAGSTPIAVETPTTAPAGAPASTSSPPGGGVAISSTVTPDQVQSSGSVGAASLAPMAAAAAGNPADRITLAPGTPQAVAEATGGTGSTSSAGASGSDSYSQAAQTPVGRVVSLIAPRPLPRPWLLLALTLLTLVTAGYLITIRRGGTGAYLFPPVAAPPLFWRISGFVVAALLGLGYLVTAVSVMMTLLTYWLPGAGSATLPAAGLYKVTAVLLSMVLTGIAARYVYYYYCWVKSRHHFAHARPVDIARLQEYDLPYLKFQVTTRGGAMGVVERTVQAVIDVAVAHPWLAPRMSVEVITESLDEASDLPALFRDASIDVHALCLPRSYETPNGTGLKARALHYMVERRLEGWNRKPGRTFIVHLDEETQVTEDHTLVLVDYLSGAPAPVSQGPILYPKEWDKAPWLCRAMESLRPFGCSECARVMSNPPPPHLHGSNLVVDEDVENRIGWDFGTIEGQAYIAEDLLFGLRAYSLLGREGFGWHGATMLEQPPLSVYWAVQQRMRWVLGALQGWQALGQRDDLLSIPIKERTRLRRAVGFRVATYALGFPVGFAGLFFLLHPAVRQSALLSPLGAWRLFIMAAGVGWVLSYQIGLARNLRYQKVNLFNRIRQHLTLLILTPVTGLFETAGPFLALTRWLVGAREARWTPTPKTTDAPTAVVAPALPRADAGLLAPVAGR
jgi:hypothetical protein